MKADKKKAQAPAEPKKWEDRPAEDKGFVRKPGKVYFRDIPQFTRGASYAVDVQWSSLLRHLEWHQRDYGLDLEPDFQRAHVWTEEQQRRFVEFQLRGGGSGKDIYTNCVGWNKSARSDDSLGPYVIVDGKQRVQAVVKFLKDELPIFGGHRFSDYGDDMRLHIARFRWHVNDLATRTEVLQWYLDLNRGGTQHTDEEITKVERLLEAEKGK